MHKSAQCRWDGRVGQVVFSIELGYVRSVLFATERAEFGVE